jgi:DNA repair protein RecO (recombination protein O)
MALVASEAIVLRTYNLAEADRIAVCLTRSAGLVRAVAKGARRMRSRFGAALEPYSFINLVFHEKENRELVTVSEAEIISSHFDLAAQPEPAEALAYIAELVGDFAPPHEANEKLYRMVKATVEALADSPENSGPIVRYFEVWLLRLAGLLPELDACAQCDNPLRPDESAFLDAESRPRCRTCSKSLGAALAGPTRGAIAATRKLGPREFVTKAREYPSAAQVQLAEFTHRLLVRALERRPRTAMSSAHY